MTRQGPRPDWSDAATQVRWREALRQPALFKPRRGDAAVMAVFDRLPDALRCVLQAELDAGNTIQSVSLDWPNAGSVFVCLNELFTVARTQVQPPAQWRSVYLPQYWREEVLEEHAGVWHTVVC